MCDVPEIPSFRGCVPAWNADHVPPQVRQAVLLLRHGRAACESRVGLHRGWPDQDPHVGRYRGGRGGRGPGPLREGPSRAGASCRRWHRSVAGPPGPVTEEAVTAGRELLRLLMQDHVDLRAVRESRVAVVGADGGCRTRVETGHTRVLGTVLSRKRASRRYGVAGIWRPVSRGAGLG